MDQKITEAIKECAGTVQFVDVEEVRKIIEKEGTRSQHSVMRKAGCCCGIVVVVIILIGVAISAAMPSAEDYQMPAWDGSTTTAPPSDAVSVSVSVFVAMINLYLYQYLL